MSRAERLLVALAAFCIAATLGYAAVRALELALFPEPNPAVIIWSERSGFLWRSAIALYIGGMGAFGGYALAARSPALAARWLARAVLLAAAAILAQGALLP
jgi:hypothetical protein